jgi:hypothetical protein
MSDLPVLSIQLTEEFSEFWGPTVHESDPLFQCFGGTLPLVYGKNDYIPKFLDWLNLEGQKKGELILVAVNCVCI